MQEINEICDECLQKMIVSKERMVAITAVGIGWFTDFKMPRADIDEIREQRRTEIENYNWYTDVLQQRQQSIQCDGQCSEKVEIVKKTKWHRISTRSTKNKTPPRFL